MDLNKDQWLLTSQRERQILYVSYWKYKVCCPRKYRKKNPCITCSSFYTCAILNRSRERKDILLLDDISHCLGTFLIVTTGRCYWLLVDRAQDYCQTFYNAQDSSTQLKNHLAPNVISDKVENPVPDLATNPTLVTQGTF